MSTMTTAQPTTNLTLRLPAEMAETLRTFAFVTDSSVNEAVKRAVAEFLTTHARAEMVQAAFEKTLSDHKIALDKLADL